MKQHILQQSQRRSQFFLLLTVLLMSFFLVPAFDAGAQCVNANSNTTSAIFPLSVVTTPANAYDLGDGDISTAAELVVNFVGVATLNVSFDQNANPGDSIIVMFGVPTANLLDWGSLGSTTFTPFSGTNATGTASATYTASTLAFVISVGTASLARIAVPVTAAAGAQSIRIQFTGIGAVAGKRNYIYDVAVKPGPVTPGPGVTICNGTEATLNASKDALAAQPVDLLWYDSDGATLLYTDPNHSGTPYTGSFTTPTLTATKTFYVRERWNGCTLLSDARPVTVTVREPITPVIDIMCADPVTLSTTTTGATSPVAYAWSASDGGNILAGASSATPEIIGAGTYSVVITDANTCIGSGTAAFTEGDCIALNLELLSFEVRSNGIAAILEWRIASTDDAVQFEIERSTDDRNWEKIGTVSAAAENHFNTYIDEQAALTAKRLQYRLKMMEANGNFSYSSTRMVNFETGINGITLYPNPVVGKSKLNIIAEHPEMIVNVVIYNITGEKVFQTTNYKDIDMGSFVPGIYLVQVNSANGTNSSHRITKQ